MSFGAYHEYFRNVGPLSRAFLIDLVIYRKLKVRNCADSDEQADKQFGEEGLRFWAALNRGTVTGDLSTVAARRGRMRTDNQIA